MLFPLDVGNVFVKNSLEERKSLQVGSDIDTRYYLHSNESRSGDSECFCTNNQGQVPNVITKLFLVFFQGERTYKNSLKNTWKLTEKALPIGMNVLFLYWGGALKTCFWVPREGRMMWEYTHWQPDVTWSVIGNAWSWLCRVSCKFPLPHFLFVPQIKAITLPMNTCD